MLFSRRKPFLSHAQSLEAKPVHLVDATVKADESGGGSLKVTLRPGVGFLFRIPEGTTKLFELDALGMFVWNCCDGKTTIHEIIHKLAKQFRLNLREAEVPTVEFLRMLIKKGLIGIPVDKS